MVLRRQASRFLLWAAPHSSPQPVRMPSNAGCNLISHFSFINIYLLVSVRLASVRPLFIFILISSSACAFAGLERFDLRHPG